MRQLPVVYSSFFANSHPSPETLLLRPELCLNTLQTLFSAFPLFLCPSPTEAWPLLTLLQHNQGETTNQSSLASILSILSIVCIVCRTEIHLKYQFFRRYFACMVFHFLKKQTKKNTMYFCYSSIAVFWQLSSSTILLKINLCHSKQCYFLLHHFQFQKKMYIY